MTFIQRPKARSIAEAVSTDSQDRIVSIAKTALQTYIASFMDSTGVNRAFTAAVSPTALQYVTDKSLQDQKDDPAKRPTQLARMYNDIRQRVPAIMLIDSALEWEEPGIGGGFERASMLGGNWQGWYRIIGHVGVVVAVVTDDPETASLLQNILAIFFKQLRREAGGTMMTSQREGDQWEVRLPTNFTVGSSSPTNVADDPKDQLFAASLDLTLVVETMFAIEKPITRAVLDGGIVGDSNLASHYGPIIDAPAYVRVQDGPFRVVISRLGPQHSVVISDPRVATIDSDAQVITPHRLGTFDLQVVDSNQRLETAPAQWTSKAVSSQTITVGVS